MPPRLFRHGELPLVLLAVLHRLPCHGYQLLAELSRLFGARYSASPGSVYPALESLEKHELLVGTETEGRRVYSVSEAGARTLAVRRAELVALEARLGVRLLDGDLVDEAVDRFIAAVRDSRPVTDPDVLVRLLNDTTDHLRSAHSRRAPRVHSGEKR